MLKMFTRHITSTVLVSHVYILFKVLSSKSYKTLFNMVYIFSSVYDELEMVGMNLSYDNKVKYIQ